MSKTTVEVDKNANESGVNLIRRFQKRVQESGVLNKARSVRYNERPKSKLSRKTSALMRITKRTEIERLKKLGKIPDKPVRKGGRK
ncbi:MAG: hypothetical protein WC835_03510 [Candidatus Paceibacterota bacterium]|jgi:ribosomal protein S21